MNNIRLTGAIAILIFLSTGCNKDVQTYNKINFFLEFSADQVRLDNLGNPSTVPSGHGTQTPFMHSMSVHYIEMSQDATTLFKTGANLYAAPETDLGGDLAIDFDSSIVTDQNINFLSLNLARLPPGTYRYIRVSVAYQNYDIDYNVLNMPGYGDLPGQTGTIASFIGFNTYIRNLTVNQLSQVVNANKLQGFWAFETLFEGALNPYNAIYTGQSPALATTVVNPIDATSPVPEGSCVVTGLFNEPLVITGNETQELQIYLSFSTNESFEWIDSNGNGDWDVDASDPLQTEEVTDMGLRGLIASWEWKN